MLLVARDIVVCCCRFETRTRKKKVAKKKWRKKERKENTTFQKYWSGVVLKTGISLGVAGFCREGICLDPVRQGVKVPFPDIFGWHHHRP